MEGLAAAVIGVGSVVGRACATALATEGAGVLAVDRSFERADEAARAIRAAGGEASPHRADPADETDARGVAEACETRWGRLDVLISCAAAMDFWDEGEDSLADWETVVRINLLGPVVYTKALLPLLRRSDAGAIVYLGSIDGILGNPSVPAYSISKAGLIPLTHVMAHRCAPIRVNCVAAAAIAQVGPGRPAAEGARRPLHAGQSGARGDSASAVRTAGGDRRGRPVPGLGRGVVRHRRRRPRRRRPHGDHARHGLATELTRLRSTGYAAAVVSQATARADAVPELAHASAFPPIADYAFLSDSEAMALVAPSGDVEWMCLPRPDSPSVFGALLDRDAGSFRVGPTNVAVPAGRRYLPGTMVLETTWMTGTGWLVVRDALLVGPWHHEEERSRTHRRVPTDNDAAHVLLRTVSCIHGSVELHVECEPEFDYGRQAARWEFVGSGYGLAVARVPELGLELRLATDLRLGLEGGRARARMTLRSGERAFAALAWSEHPLPQTFEEADEGVERTARFWREWLARGRFPDHPWREQLQRSALTLKGLIFSPTGAMLAAATTSLPETPGGERNWDYRYSWVRDSTFGLWGLYTLGFDAEANDFFYFMADLAEGEADLQVMYTIGGERELPEETARPSVRLRGRAAGADRQRRLPAAAARHVGCAPRLGLPARTLARASARAGLADASPAGRVRARGLARAGPRDLGGPRRSEALHLVEGLLLDRRRPRRTARCPARRARDRRALAGGGRRDSRRRLRQRRRRPRGLRPALRDHVARRVAAAAAARAVPSGDGPADPSDRARDCGRADGRRPRTPLPRRRDRRRALGRGRLVHDLLLLARLGARRDRRGRAGPEALREAALPGQPIAAVRRGARSRDGQASR